jgi:tetratricopeptide (TPR) repeat protein
MINTKRFKLLRVDLPNATIFFTTTLCLALGLTLTFSLSGCNQNTQTLVYGKAIAKLNAEANQAMQQGNTKLAIERLEAARSLLPSQPELIQNLAAAYHADAQYAKAIASYDQLLTLQPAKAVQWQKNLGITHEALGDELKSKREEAAKANSEAGNTAVGSAEQEAAVKEQYQLALTAYKAVQASKPSKELEEHIELLEKQMITKPAATAS